MICVAISDKNVDNCLSILDKVEMAEIRLDLTGFDADEIKKVFSHPTPAIATCRPNLMKPDEQLRKLTLAIESGARYVDIEIEASRKQQRAIINVARKRNCQVIVSYHNFKETPGIRKLNIILKKCFKLGADVAKLTTLSNSESDNAKILSLYTHGKPIVAFGMGEKGKPTRIIAPLLGAAFTFAAPDNFEGTAPGQLTYSKMKEILNVIDKELIRSN